MKLLKLLRCLVNGVLCAIIVPFMPAVGCICLLRRKLLGFTPEQDPKGTTLINGALIPSLVYLMWTLPALFVMGWWAWVAGVLAQAAMGFGIGVYMELYRESTASPCTT